MIPSRRALVVAALVLAVCLAASLSVQVPFLSNDGPARAYGAFVHNHYDDVARAYPRFVTLNTPPTTHGFDVVFRLVEPMFGWQIALHAAHIVAAELFALAFFAFVTSLSRERAVIGLLGFPLAVQSVLYLGLLPFLYATGLALFALAVFVRSGRYAPVVTSALLTAAALCHPFPVCAAGVFMGAIVLSRTTRAQWPKQLALLFACSLPALVLVVLASRAEISGTAPSLATWDPLVDRTLFLARNFQPGGAWRPLFALALAAFGLVRFAFNARNLARKPARNPASSSASAAAAPASVAVERALVVVAALFVAAAVVMPRDLGAWELASVRPLPFALLPLIALVDVEHLESWKRTAAVAACALYAASSFAWAAATGLRVKAATAPALALLDERGPNVPNVPNALNALNALNAPNAPNAPNASNAIPRDWLPMIAKPQGDVDDGASLEDSWDIPRFAPLFHLADLYAIDRGGVTLFSQADAPSLHDVLRIHHAGGDGESPPEQDYALRIPSATSASQRAEQVRILGAIASTHDGLVFYGEPRDVDGLVDAGFVSDTASAGGRGVNDNGLFVGHFEGCRGTVHIEHLATDPASAGAKEVAVDVGWWPRKTPAVTLHIDAGGDAADVVDAPLERFACGDVWLNVRGRHCAEVRAGTALPVRALFARDGSGILRCTIE